MSGPFAEGAPAYMITEAAEMLGRRWPVRIAITEGLEPGIIVTCRRGDCDAVLLELSWREVESGWPITPAALGVLAGEHIPDCASGRSR